MTPDYYTLFNNELDIIHTIEYQPDKTCQDFLNDLLNHMSIHPHSITIDDECHHIIGRLAVWCKKKYSIDAEHSSILFKNKNSDYGNAFELCSKVGIIVRLIDKLKRILHLEMSGNTIHYESIKDNYIDMFNYTILYRILQ